MAKFTREQLKKWNDGAAEGWSVDIQTLIYWNEKTLSRRTEPDENGNLYEATLRYHDEYNGEGWAAKRTGRQILTLTVNHLIAAGSNQPEDECKMYQVIQKSRQDIGEPQNKKLFSYMQKQSFSIDFDEIIQEAKCEESAADLLETEQEENANDYNNAETIAYYDELEEMCGGIMYNVTAHHEIRRNESGYFITYNVDGYNGAEGEKSAFFDTFTDAEAALYEAKPDTQRISCKEPEENTTETAQEAPEEETQTAPKFDAELIREARSRFYLVLVDKETEAEYIGSETAEDGDRVRIYATSWEYEAEEIAHNNEELRRIIEEDKAAEDPKETAAEPQEATEEAIAEEMPTEAEEAATEDESAAQEETPAAAFPDMFAELAKAYAKGTTAPKPPKKAAEPTETPTEEEKTEEEPPAPPKTAPGYTGETSEAFTAEEIQALTNGEQVRKVIEGYNTFTIATPYTERTALVYRMSRYIYRNEPETDPLTPGDNLQYIGFINGGKFYANTVPIVEEMREDINNALLHEIPDEATAEERAADASDWQKERTEAAKGYDYTREAQRHFYEGTAPTIQLYRDGGKKYSAADIIRYIENPGEIVTEYRNTYAENHAAEIHREYIEYNRTMEAYKAIITDAENPAHVIKAIADSIHEEKTVRIELSNGETVKAEAWTVRNIRNYGTIDAWHLSTADAEKLPKNENGRPADITAEDIKAIYHGQRTLYRAA